MPTNAVKLSWTPIRVGEFYCSPACGGRCTLVAFEKVTKEANQLAKTLGDDWKVEVFENLGWHHVATRIYTNIRVTVGYQKIGNHYYCSIENRWIGDGATPQLAVISAQTNFRNDLKELLNISWSLGIS